MNSILISLLLLLAANDDNPYHKAEALASAVLAAHHQDSDTFVYCDGKLRSMILRDSIINKPGGVGVEYNYPIYRFETEIIYYKSNQIAAIETREIQLKRYDKDNVTTGIRKTAIIDSLHTYYFDTEQKLITHEQSVDIKSKLCKEAVK
jgi:hypothetical protein